MDIGKDLERGGGQIKDAREKGMERMKPIECTKYMYKMSDNKFYQLEKHFENYSNQ